MSREQVSGTSASTIVGEVEQSFRDRLARPVSSAVLRKRELFADFCRLLLASASGDDVELRPSRPTELPIVIPGLSPRVRETLDRLLAGDSEKEVATQLKLSRHTVHVYIKTLYRKLNVSSRGELLAKFVRPPAVALRGKG